MCLKFNAIFFERFSCNASSGKAVNKLLIKIFILFFVTTRRISAFRSCYSLYLIDFLKDP